jgi:preprotein translocase subunit SecG
MQDIVFLIIKIFFVILAVSVIGMLVAIILRKSKQNSEASMTKENSKD